MKLLTINWLIIGLLTEFGLQLQAQEIKTRQDAINFLDDTYWQYTISEKSLLMDGKEEETERIVRSYIIENEFLIFKASCRKYNGKQIYDGTQYDYSNTKEFLFDLTDSISMEKLMGEKGSKAEKNFKLYLMCKNFKIYNDDLSVNVKTKRDREWLETYNLRIEELYSSFKVLKSIFDLNEKADYKLMKFKDDYIKAGMPKDISEEQRKYIVQANAANAAKDFTNALLLYRKALDVNKFSYPDAYFNMALILSQLEHYYQAIYAMKEYLILAPGSEDARPAQDKIYEWELNIKN